MMRPHSHCAAPSFLILLCCCELIWSLKVPLTSTFVCNLKPFQYNRQLTRQMTEAEPQKESDNGSPQSGQAQLSLLPVHDLQSKFPQVLPPSRLGTPLDSLEALEAASKLFQTASDQDATSTAKTTKEHSIAVVTESRTQRILLDKKH